MARRADPSEIELLSLPGEPFSAGPVNNEPGSSLPARSQRLRQWKWDSITIDVLGVLLVVPFLALIIFCASKEGKPVDEVELNRMNQGLWIVSCRTHFGGSFF